MNLFHLFHKAQHVPPAPHKTHALPKSPTFSSILGVALMALGAGCIVFSHHVYHIFPYLLGPLMIVAGLRAAYIGVHTQEYKTRETQQTSFGIVLAIVGAVILWNGPGANALIGAAWGIIGIIEGSESLNHAFYFLCRKERFWPSLLQAGIELVLAILLLLDPAGNLHHHITILGIEQICVGLQILHWSRLLWKSGVPPTEDDSADNPVAAGQPPEKLPADLLS